VDGPLSAGLARAARELGGPLPSIDVADALLDERPELDPASNLPRLRAWRPQLAVGHKGTGLPQSTSE
jgi:hypothetical protein